MFDPRARAAAILQSTTSRVAEQMELIAEGPDGTREAMTIMVAHCRVLAVFVAASTTTEAECQAKLEAIGEMILAEGLIAVREALAIRKAAMDVGGGPDAIEAAIAARRASK